MALPSIVFMGTPDFAVPTLEALIAADYPIRAVVTQPDRAQGRGRHLAPPPVKVVAERAGIAVMQPEKLRTVACREALTALAPDFFVVVAYGKILSPRFLAIPRIAPLNVHASLLPKYRGAAPLAWALLHGERETGVSIMRMDEGLDTGPVFHQASLTIAEQDNAQTLHDKVARLGAETLIAVLPRIAAGSLQATAQPAEGASYAPLMEKAMGAIDFAQRAEEVANHIRAFTPWPSAFCLFRAARHIIHAATAVAVDTDPVAEPGTIVAWEQNSGCLEVQCGRGRLAITRIQCAGRKVQSAADFVSGYRVALGERFISPSGPATEQH